jgi:arylsulfatase A-like enzyme
MNNRLVFSRYAARRFALAGLLMSGVLLSSAGARFAFAAERPNILFVFSDDHSPTAIGAYNRWLKDYAPTPNIDQLARDGVLMENSFCTNSICGPSRAVILTGKHSHLNGFRQNGDRFDGTQQTFPKLLQQAGYQTAMIGKWHLASNPTGFDHWEVLPGQGAYYNPRMLTAEGPVEYEGHCTEIVTQRAIKWLKEERATDQPFLLMCQHKAPHRTWMPATQHLTLLDDVELPEPATLFDKWEDNASPARHQEMEIDRHMDLVYDLKLSPEDASRAPRSSTALDKSGAANLNRMTPAQRQAWDAAYGPKNHAFAEANLRGKDLVRWKYQRYMKDYLRCVKGVDESLGQLRATLDELGLGDNTVVIYSSDQGFYLGDHGWFDKRWMYEESLEMPLIVHWPGTTKPGTRATPMVQNLDYAPTFLEMAGVAVPSDMQGASLVPILQGSVPEDWRTQIYYHYYEYPGAHQVARHYGVRTERYKLIRFYQFDEWEFYDLQSDPDELRNQYNNPQYAETVAQLKVELERLKTQYQDDTDVRPMPPEWRKKAQEPRQEAG